jgi:hypothetical protein
MFALILKIITALPSAKGSKRYHNELQVKMNRLVENKDKVLEAFPENVVRRGDAI